MSFCLLIILSLLFVFSMGVLVLIQADYVLGDDSVGLANRPEHAGRTYSLNVPGDDLFENKLTAPFKTSRSTGPSVLTLLGDDMVSLLKKPVFYLVIGGLSVVPGTIEYEPRAISLKWMNSMTADRFFESGEVLGNAAVPFSLALVSYSAGKIFDSPGTISFASDLFRANVINSFLASAMKVSINRTRPDGAPYSFPSGHTSHAFATAGVISAHYGLWAGVASRMVAAYIGISRLQENKHYLSDVIAGTVLGSYIAHHVTRRTKHSTDVGVAPFLEKNRAGVCLNVMF